MFCKNYQHINIAEADSFQRQGNLSEISAGTYAGALKIPITTGVDSTQDKIKTRENIKGIDTTALRKDTIAVKADTVKLDSMAIDSTARLKYFNYKRHDVPYVQLNLNNEPSFYAQPSAGLITRTVTIDSTGKYVIVRDKIAGQETKILLRIPIDEYLKLQLALNEKSDWDQIAGGYELKSSKKELGELIKNITNLEIPLPSVGVLSIFGKPKISLRIGGAVDIHGAWVNTTTQGVTASALGNTRNEPDFKQQVQINVNGTIGDKLNISADWNTERTFEYQNQLHIKYTGYEDEIVQSVEAGNVSMQTTPLVGGSEALFGVKAQFKLGPLSLTTLASQKKGEIKTVSVSNGSTSQPFDIRAYNYETNNYFVDSIYADTSKDLNIFYKYYNSNGSTVLSQYYIVKIEVWKSTQTYTPDKAKERQVNAYIDLPDISGSQEYPAQYRQDISNPIPGQEETGRFVLLTPDVDYTLHPNTGYITFHTNIQDQDAIAVAYEVQNSDPGPSDDRYYGEFLNSKVVQSLPDTSRLILKLIKPAYLKPQYKKAWQLLLKNIYYLGGSNIKQDGFDLQVEYDNPGGNAVTSLNTAKGTVQLLHAFGLDNLDASGNPSPDGDGKFDWVPTITILPATGELIFPTLQPFGGNYPASLPDSLRYQTIYDTSQIGAQNSINNKWEITGKYSGEASSTYQLGFNIVENSVQVTLNGRELTPNVDYTVDYNIGQLTILNRDALVPGANLKITYEQNDLFQLASKTLIGARGVLNISDKTKLGFSIMNLNQQTLSQRVRIGEEPLSNTIMGVDFNTSADLPFVTKGLDKLFSTKEMSSFSISGEYARINPNPNTMKSTIPADKGESIAYIDDFEGSKKLLPIGVNYTGWKDLSPPGGLSAFKDTSLQHMMFYKAKSFWYTITPSDVQVPQIWGGKKKVATQNNQVPVLDYVFMPDSPGTYNWNPRLQNPKINWGGMMKSLSSVSNDLQAQNIEYIEFWLKVDSAPPNSYVYIDLGRISEDVIPNNILNTEDQNHNGVVDQGEDTGLDEMFDQQERDSVKKLGYSAWTKNDPSGDDFVYNPSDKSGEMAYYYINGTEGNAVLTDIGRIPDTEDLNLNGNLDKVNSYFRYAVPLDTNEAKKLKYITSPANTKFGWHLYRIPLQDTSMNVGNPTLSDVEYIRLFTTGVTSEVHVRFAEFNLVGNEWEQTRPYDTVMAVSVINFEDNPNYSFPPGVTQVRDLTQPNQNVYSNEQSMDLIVKGLQPDSSREAIKYLYKPLDVFNYKEMKFFVHGDETPGTDIADTSGGGYSAQLYFRFGSDTNNFYEYRLPITKGWNDVDIPFSSLTTIKQKLDSINYKNVFDTPIPGQPGRYYGIKGNPSLTSVRFLSFGIINITKNSKLPHSISGEVWIDELRVLGADNHPGWAYKVATTLKLADLMTVNFNMSETDPYFHSLSTQFGSRINSKSWNLSASLNVLKFLPFNMPGSSLNISYSHSESIGKPLYIPGTDIKVDSAAAIADERIKNQTDSTRYTGMNGQQIITNSQSINVSDSWAASNIAFRIPSSSWIVNSTFNALSFGFNYNKTFSRSPTVLVNRSWQWNANMNYAVTLSPDNYIYAVNIPIIGSIFSLLKDYKKLKIYYSPQNISFSLAVQRNRTFNENTSVNNSPIQGIYSHNFTTNRNFNTSWKLTDGGLFNVTTNYSMALNSSLAYLEFNSDNTPKPENEVWHKILSGNFFGNDYAFSQNLSIQTSPKLPTLWDIDKYFNLTASYSVSYRWNNNFAQKEAGRSAGFANQSSIGLNLALKALTEPLFASSKSNTQNENNLVNQRMEGRERNFGRGNSNMEQGKKIPEEAKPNVNDTASVRDTARIKEKKNPLKNAWLFVRNLSRILFFDYESININFTNSNNVTKSALPGTGTGLYNFFGLTYNQNYGPPRLFMLGLNSDVGNIRAPGLSITDVYSEQNNLTFQTSKPLWEGARINLNWKVGWSLNKSVILNSDTLTGFTTPQYVNETGTISRSFFSLPPVSLLSIFKSGISRVHDLYNPDAADPAANLSNAFTEGFESLPLLSRISFLKDFANYIPRPNWSITWDGLEKYWPFKMFTERASLNHAYTSQYSQGWSLDPNGNTVVQTQTITYGFAPLIGLNMTFAKLWNGNLSGSIKYSTNSSYSLGVSTQNITESFQKDIGVSATYSKTGFELPLFGVSLKNDIEFTFSYTNSQSTSILYDMNKYVDGGIPQNGTDRVTIEPRVKYTISSKVTIAIFYQKSTTEPVGASQVPPMTTNTAGLDVHISIQ